MKDFPVNRPVSVLMLTLLMILFGGAAYRQLPRDLFPEVGQPQLVIETRYEGAASIEVEQSVTRRIEEKLGTVKGVAAMSSLSGDERSRIAVTFRWGTDMDLAAMDVRAKLDEVGGDLPDDADDPVVLRGSASSGAVIILNVAPHPDSPDTDSPGDLRQVVEGLIKPRLERINGVASVRVKGGREYEVRVRVVPERLRAVGLSILDVRDALERENLSQRAGRLLEGENRFLIRTVGSVSPETLSRLIVSRPGEEVRRLGEVAEVVPGLVARAPESLARLKTGAATTAKPAVEVSIFKKSGGNSVEICAAAREVREEMLAGLARRTGSDGPPPLQITIAYDESVFIRESLDMVRSNGITGLALASVILLVFLGRVQSTVIVVLAMPVSVIATFSLFYAGGISINIFSMAGLTLAVGMVVDNAIVVTEAIFQKLGRERRVKKAVTEAIAEIGPAVWASTLTTVAVFLPVVFVPGIAGQIFRDLSWVITYTLVFSMVVAFTLIPMLTYKVMGAKLELVEWLNLVIGWILWPLTRAAVAGSAAYRKLLSTMIRSVTARVLLVLLMAGAFAASIRMLPPAEFFPETRVESYELTLRSRAGQTLDAVDRGARILENSFASIEPLASYGVSVSPREVSFIASFDREEVIAGKIRPLGELAPVLDALETDPRLRDVFLDHRLESLNPMQSLLGTNRGDILLKVSGPDLEGIGQILTGEDGEGGLRGTIAANRSAYGVSRIGRVPGGIPERILRIRREAAADRGLSLADIADQVEAAIDGIRATDIEVRNATYDITLASAAEITSQEDLLDLDIFSPAGGPVWKLAEVATLESRTGPRDIEREERERVVTVPIFIDRDRIALGDAVARLQEPVEEAMAPYRGEGYRVMLGGASEEMDRSLGFLLYAFLVAVVLVYMIMASQFESLIHPLTIMFSVPLSLVGAVVGLKLGGELISLTAMIGVIMLAGIVVNNAIILVDYTNLLRARGLPRNEAIVTAGLTRLRPILMTTLTTVLGMLPLALGVGTGAELYRPLALVVVWGLSFSTLLTLIFIPAVYTLLEDLSDLSGLISLGISTWLGGGGEKNALRSGDSV